MRNPCTVLLLAALAACSDGPPVPVDSTPAAATVDTPAPVEPAPVPTSWDAGAGPVLLVAGERPDQVIVVSPDVDGVVESESLDVTDLVGATATLLGRSGSSRTTALGTESDEGVARCNGWPVLTTSAGTGGSLWAVGFLDSVVRPLALDSLQAMPGRDSLAFVARVARLASEPLLNPTGGHAARFHGLPFVVYDARFFTHGPREFAIVQVVRRVNQEAQPLEEHTLMLLERRGSGGAWRPVRSERTSGREEVVGRSQVLAAATLRGEPLIILLRDTGSGVRYVIRWRGNGDWSRRWASALSPC